MMLKEGIGQGMPEAKTGITIDYDRTEFT